MELVFSNTGQLNHGIALSSDGKTLYASSSSTVYSWAYNMQDATVNSTRQTLVQNMSNADHTTRTLMLSKKAPGTLLVSRGSNENMDMVAQQLNSGRSQIKAFDVNNLPGGKPYDYPSQGKLIGWGLRNSVGVAEEPVTGGVFSVENSADDIDREGQDIHEDDPGEEMNFHGFLNGSTDSQGGNYGYPDCFALWGTKVPDVGSMAVGSQFALNPNGKLNDSTCASNYVPPRLTFQVRWAEVTSSFLLRQLTDLWQAHMAPLDMLFEPDGSAAYVSFHGSCTSTAPEASRPTSDPGDY